MSAIESTTSGTPSTARAPVRRLLDFNVIAAVVLAALGYFICHWVGTKIGNKIPGQMESDQDDIAVILGYVGAILGWLIGLGFFNYPISRMMGRPPTLVEGEEHGVWRYWRLCTDHKVVSIQYVVAVAFFFFVGGINAMLIRGELTSVNGTLVPAGNYLTLVSLHGTMMLMMMSAGVLGPLGNYLIPLMIGARRMAFSRVESLTLWLTVLAGVVLLSAIFLGGFPTGWTGYAPLSDEARAGMDSYLVSFALIGVSLTLVGLNIIATVMTMRAPGLYWNRIPIFVWGLVTTSILAVLAAPVLFAVLFMEALDRTIGTTFFLASNGGSPFLWDNLFWFFGHPEVYILALPGFGIVLEILPVFARKPLWGYRVAVAGMFGVALLSFMVWQHHLFVSGINANLRPFYMFTTELISIPTGIIFLIGMGTLWRARIRYTVPMLFALSFFFNFLIGGLSGVFLSDVPSDVTTHGSYFVMAHFHYTIVGGLVFALMGGLYYWLPKMTGYKLNERLGKIHFWTMFIFFNGTFFPLFAAGLLGMPRRVSAYEPSLHTLNVVVSISAWCLGLSFLVFLFNLVWTQFLVREPAGPNPWMSKSLEWQLPSPVPAYNFERIPVINSAPYAYGVPDAPPVADFGVPAVRPGLLPGGPGVTPEGGVV
jgi:cytochrome c oxidase subunit 1